MTTSQAPVCSVAGDRELLSPTMQAALNFAREHGGLQRWPGGFWGGADETFDLRNKTFGTTTVQALVTRGVFVYDEWKETRNGRFPIRAAIAKTTGAAS